jgi:hypothetical protein
MQIETIRALADWLQYGTNTAAGAANGPGSVNALSAAVVRDAGDAAPVTITTFGDETRTPWCARREIPRESNLAYPLLGVIVTDPSDLSGEVETIIRDGTVSPTILYAHQQALTEQGLRDWHYTCRALQQSVRTWMLNVNASYRTRNSIIVQACMDMRVLPPFSTNGDVPFSGGLTLRLNVRDTAP